MYSYGKSWGQGAGRSVRGHVRLDLRSSEVQGSVSSYVLS